MSIIGATRKGFLYQDRVAVQIYLKALLDRNVNEYYIDFPFSTAPQKSIDIKHIDKNKNESIYEIKSGEEFKKDKIKKDSSEVRDAFLVLKEYSESGITSQLTLILRKEIKGKVSDYWHHLEVLSRVKYFRYADKTSLKWLNKKLSLPGVTSLKALFDILRKVRVINFEDDICFSKNDSLPHIDDLNISIINDLSTEFKANALSSIYPPIVLMYELYHLCQVHAGGVDIHPLFLGAIKRFVVHRRLIDECYKQEKPGLEKSKEKIEEEVKSDFDKYLDLVPADRSPQIIDTQEGGVVV